MSNEASNSATNFRAGGDINFGIQGDFVGGDKIGLSVEEVTALVIQLKTAEQPTVWDGRIPYLGLSAFQESDAEFFFGRESLVDDLLGRLQQSHFITIAGPSGSGKSSVARAGLFHALRRGRLPKSDKWLLATMLPGNHPLESLAVAIERLTKEAGSANSLRHKGLENPHALHQQVEILLTDDPSQRLVLLVDQFEEVFTQTKNEAEQAAFIQLLTHSAKTEGSRLTILLSLRSDFISHCARYPTLRELLNQQFMLVGGMEAHDLAKAITLPALEVGAEIDPALVSRIMADMKGEPGALPLMSFALRDLFEAEKSAVGKPMDLTLAEYVQRGGIEKALERHANAVFDDFSAEQQALARGVFSKLIEVGQGRVDTRRTAVFTELIPAGQDASAVSQVVEILARAGARLLTTSGGDYQTSDTATTVTITTVTIAHERLIDAWPWLRQLVDENREAIALQNQIANDAKAWAEKQDGGYLYRGGRLAQVEEKLAELTPSLDELSHQFVQASLDERQRDIDEKEAREQQKLAQERALAEAQRQRADEAEKATVKQKGLTRTAFAVGGVAIILFIVAGIAGIWAVLREAEAQRQARLALAQSLAALSSSVYQRTADSELAALLAIEAHHLNREEGGSIDWFVDGGLRPLLDQVPPYFNHTLEGHEEEVNWVAFSPDGQTLASGGSDDAIWLWNLGEPTAVPVVLIVHVLSVAFSPDGQILASGSGDGTIRLWNVGKPTDPIVLCCHGGEVRSVAFSPDGQALASGSGDGTIRLWNVGEPTAAPVVLSGHRFSVNSVAFSPDGQSLASGSGAFSTDGQSLASFSIDGTIQLWDVGNPIAAPILLSGHEDQVRSVAFSPDGQTLASGGDDNTIRLWDVGEPTAAPVVLSGHEDQVRSVAFSPDGQTLASGSSDGTIWLWDVGEPTAAPVVFSGHERGVNSVAFSPDGQSLASGGNDHTIRLWDLGEPTAAPVLLSGHENWAYSVAFSPDGRSLASGSFDYTIQLWDVGEPTAAPVVLSGHEDWVVSVAFSPDGQTLASGGADNTIRLWDLGEPTAAPIILNSRDNQVLSVAFSPDGQSLASGNGDGTIWLWDVGEPTAAPVVLSDHESSVYSVAFSPDGQSLASGNGDGTIWLWDVGDSTAAPVVLSDHESSVYSVAFSPDGQSLVSGSLDHTIRLWDVGEPTAAAVVLSGHENVVVSVAFSPDGQTVASGSADRTIRLWDVGEPTAAPIILNSRDNQVLSVAFSPDGQTLASGGLDGTIWLWPMLDKLVEIGCQKVWRNLSWQEWQQYLPREPYRPTCPQLPPHSSVPEGELPSPAP